MHVIDNLPDRLEEAILATRQSDYNLAVKLFEKEHDALVNPEADFERTPVLSYYGLCLAIVWGDTDRSLKFCQAAVRWCATDPDLFFNLGMVQLRCRRRDLAVVAFREGLKLDPLHRALCQTRDRLRRRRRPFIPYLDRGHLLNKFAGMCATRWLVQSIDDPI